MNYKKENVKVTYDHEVDHMKDKNDPIKQTRAAQPNEGLKETIDAMGNKNRMTCQYVVGKTPTEKYVTPGSIEQMRPPAQEFNG